MKRTRKLAHAGIVVGLVIFASRPAATGESYSPYAGRPFPERVYWGDTHLHTSYSVDAYTFGDRIGPDVAYRFARGEAVRASNGMAVRLHRPLDFLVVADHAESIGVMAGLEEGDPTLLETEAGKRLSLRMKEVSGRPPLDRQSLEALIGVEKEIFRSAKHPEVSEAFKRSVWSEVVGAAERYNDPGRFTAFIGYEWSSLVPKNGLLGNLHRVVVFRDGAENASQVIPLSALDNDDPAALWNYMAAYETKTGGQVLAIPHNGNVSNGEMFPLQTFTGQPLSLSYAEQRSRWEPLYEVTQIKGTSEAHPFLSPTDEFADYEIWNSWSGRALPQGRSWNEEERSIKEGEYARSAFKRGLALQRKLGINPFKFGLIGSTDAHTSLSAVEENNFWGKAPITEPGHDRALANKLDLHLPLTLTPQSRRRAWMMGSAGYAAVWATENTREALFAAMKRKETYATTGPRMTVRFFGGWDYAPEDAFSPDLALIGYKKGVPMGGDITNAPRSCAPHFLIRAVKDPDGANLDRVQVIKGWLDRWGETREKIYNVALSDGRKVGANGKIPPVGSTVDVPNAVYKNTIGDAELAVVWTDPDFNSQELAFYYVRVLEIPTPRWTAYDAKFFAIADLPTEVPMIIQERAFTAPIWYTPQREYQQTIQ